MGTISLVHRYYDPGTEQFLSVDPLVNQTGTPFAYTAGDPVNAADPLGESLWGDITGVVKSTVHFVEKHKKAFEIAGLVVGSVAVVASGGILLAGAGAVEFAGVSVDTLATVSDVASLGAAATDLPGCLGSGIDVGTRFVACAGAISGGLGGAVGRLGSALDLLPASGDALRGLALANLEAGAASIVFHSATLASHEECAAIP